MYITVIPGENKREYRVEEIFEEIPENFPQQQKISSLTGPRSIKQNNFLNWIFHILKYKSHTKELRLKNYNTLLRRNCKLEVLE